jgi:hypothetical protein
MTTNNTTPTAAVCPSYNELQQLLTQLVDSGPASRVLPLALQLLGKPLVLSALLARIAHQPRWLQKVQDASYYHRNGFDKLVLVQGDNFKLRLHHFRPVDKLLPSENIHDHRWPFASAIISGQLHMKLFKANATNGVPVHQYRYNSQRGANIHRVEPIGPCRLATTDYLIYEAGSQYFMPTTALHQIVYQPGIEALTLVLTGKAERTTCRLFAKGALQEEDL